MAFEALAQIGAITVFRPYFIIVLALTIVIFLLLRVFKDKIGYVVIPAVVAVGSMVSSAFLIIGTMPSLPVLYWFSALHAGFSILFSLAYALAIKLFVTKSVK